MKGLPQLLLIHGDAERRDVLAQFIESLDRYEVVDASDGAEAAALLKKAEIACIVSDIDLDEIDGWRLVRMVRSGVFNCAAATPFFVVTSTWCKRIAETTAREFDVDALIPFAQFHRLKDYLEQDLSLLPQKQAPAVLAIEDAEETASLIERILRTRFSVDIAPDGLSGLELWRDKKHPIILLDVMLPGMSGPEVMREILAEKPEQSIVIMTAHGSADLAEELMLQGACDFISKPFRTEQLRKVCEIAARREDFLVSNQQFVETIETLKLNEHALASQTLEHQAILDNLSTAVLELDENGRISFVNQAWLRLTGLSEALSLGKRLVSFTMRDSFVQGISLEEAIHRIYHTDQARETLEFKLRDQYGQGIWVEARLSQISHQPENKLKLSVAMDDISARKRAEQRLEHLAMHDSLTGLYNRHFFDSELKRLAALSYRYGSHHCLLYIDLDHFKAINDTQGNNQGDLVLKEVAEKLQQRLRETDRLCRIGGDEFTALLIDTTLEEAAATARNLCKLLSDDPYRFEDQVFKISCSIGITAINGHVAKPQVYLQQADIALYIAKNHGRNCVHVYTDEDQEAGDIRSSMKWLHTVKNAIANDDLVLHFQPIYHIPTNQVSYYEALVRLMIDDQIIYPGDFIPALERFEDVALLDQHVIAKAFKMLADYPELKRIAINLSAQAFRNDSVVPWVRQMLTEHNVDPNRIIFEITESASLSNLSVTQTMVGQLSQMGCGFSIDDFGTGFSTFSYLKNLPADTVKIDGSFIRELTSSRIDLALVKAIREVAAALGKSTVAEFVEVSDTLNLLREINVDYAQGFFLGKPMAIDDLLAEMATEPVFPDFL